MNTPLEWNVKPIDIVLCNKYYIVPRINIRHESLSVNPPTNVLLLVVCRAVFHDAASSFAAKLSKDLAKVPFCLDSCPPPSLESKQVRRIPYRRRFYGGRPLPVLRTIPWDCGVCYRGASLVNGSPPHPQEDTIIVMATPTSSNISVHKLEPLPWLRRGPLCSTPVRQLTHPTNTVRRDLLLLHSRFCRRDFAVYVCVLVRVNVT